MDQIRPHPHPATAILNSTGGLQTGNNSAASSLALGLGDYVLPQHHQLQQQSQQQHQPIQPYPQQNQQGVAPLQYSIIQSQPGQFLHFPGANAMTLTAVGNANNLARMQFAERERQIKRRTKTGCMTCRKRRIKCDEGKPTCQNCIKSRRDCEGYQQQQAQNTNLPPNRKTDSTTPPAFNPVFNSEYSTPSTLSSTMSGPSSFSPINQRRVPLTPSPRFTPYDIFPRSPMHPSISKDFDVPTSDFIPPDFTNDFPDLSAPIQNDELSTPPPTARISIDSLLNLSSAALNHPPIDAPLNALFSPTTNLLPQALLKPYNAALFAHWINTLSQAMATLDRFPTDSAVLEANPGVHYPNPRVPHEDSVYSFLIPHLAMAPSGRGVLHATLACAAAHRGEKIYGMKNYHIAKQALKDDTENGITYFVAVTLLGMFEVLGGKSIKCMYLARDWILSHKTELKASLQKNDMEVTVRDVIIEHMKWTFARTAIHRGMSALPGVADRERFILPMSDFRELFIPRAGGDSTVGVADSLILLLAQTIDLPDHGENELKAHIVSQLTIWPATLPRAFRAQWSSPHTISTTRLNAIHFIHPSLAAIHLLHRSGIIYYSIYFNPCCPMRSVSSSPEAVAAARDVLRIVQPLIDEASTCRWSVLGALTLAFVPVFIAGHFLKSHLRDTPPAMSSVLPEMEWLDNLGQIVETEEDMELREVERMIGNLKMFLGGVEGRVVEL